MFVAQFKNQQIRATNEFYFSFIAVSVKAALCNIVSLTI